jgi:hypothetical protein
VGLLSGGVVTKACVQARASETMSRIVVLLCTREQIFLPKIGRQIFAWRYQPRFQATKALSDAAQLSMMQRCAGCETNRAHSEQ